MEKHKYVILGAGISGLSVANFLKSEDYIIVEKENKVGGYCKTIYQDDFIWDYAGHFFHFQEPDNQKYFEDLFKTDGFVEREKNTKIYYDTYLVNYPFQCNIHQLKKDEFIDCLYDLYFKDKEEKVSFYSFKDMLYSKFGRSISEKFLIPYNQKLYACDLNQLDSNAMGRFFPYASTDEIIKNFRKQDFSTYNGSFIYPEKGAQVFIDFLNSKIDKSKVWLNSTVEKIDSKNKTITVNDKEIGYEFLISTIPFKKLLEDCNYPENIIKCFTCNKVLVFNMGFDAPATNRDVHWIYYPGEEFTFYRVGFYNNILGTEKMSLYVEVGFDEDAKIDLEKEKEKVILGLKKAGVITHQKLIALNTIIMNPAYVHISNISEEKKKEIKNELAEDNIFTIGRYGDWTYCSMEDCFMQAKEVAKELLEKANEN